MGEARKIFANHFQIWLTSKHVTKMVEFHLREHVGSLENA